MARDWGSRCACVRPVAPGEIATPMTGQEDEDPRNQERLGHPARPTRRCSRDRRCDCISCEPAGRLRDECVVGRGRGMLQMGPQAGSHLTSNAWQGIRRKA